jgi:hypothetical protein
VGEAEVEGAVLVGVGYQKQQNKTVRQATLWRPVQGGSDGGDDGSGGDPAPCTHPKGKCK